MRFRKRVSVPAPTKRQARKITGATQSNGTHSANKTISPYLASLTANCIILDLDPSCCIPLYLVRDILRNAVAKLKLSITGKSESTSMLLPGYVSASPTSMVIPLQDELEYLIKDYFMSICDSEEEAMELIRAHDKWYGIIDGCQLHAAIMELRDEIPDEWTEFRWKVTCLRYQTKLAISTPCEDLLEPGMSSTRRYTPTTLQFSTY